MELTQSFKIGGALAELDCRCDLVSARVRPAVGLEVAPAQNVYILVGERRDHGVARRGDLLRGRICEFVQLGIAIAGVEELAQRLIQERSEEHTSELQSRFDLVCRLLL